MVACTAFRCCRRLGELVIPWPNILNLSNIQARSKNSGNHIQTFPASGQEYSSFHILRSHPSLTVSTNSLLDSTHSMFDSIDDDDNLRSESSCSVMHDSSIDHFLPRSESSANHLGNALPRSLRLLNNYLSSLSGLQIGIWKRSP